MGITDSILYPGKSSFACFEYPSRLPAAVQRRMECIARDLIAGIGVDYSMFNIEMFYNAASDAIHVIEINPRMSYQFADMFAKVDGSNSYTTQLQLCMGEKPDFVKGTGQYGVAASWVLRLFENQRVTRVPTKQELREIQRLYPDALIVIKVEEGTVLSDLSQDEQSYRYAVVNLGGRDWQDLQARFCDLNSRLNFEFASIQTCDDEARGRFRVAAGASQAV
jgi:hypothetical protein